MKTCPNKKIRGFTLVELMVAMAITTIIVTILISITSVSLDTWNRSRAEIRAARQAQAMTEIMARDFEAMVARSGNNFEWLVASAQTTDSTVSIEAADSPNSADLIFFTGATDRYQGDVSSGNGDISTVGYSLRAVDPIDASNSDSKFKTFVLYRKLVNPDVTFTNLLGLPTEEDSALKSALKSAFKDAAGDVGSALGDATEMDHMANFVCENVHQFSVTFHIDFLETNDGSPGDNQKRTRLVTLGSEESITEIRMTGSGLQLIPKPLSGLEKDIEDSGQITAIEISITVLSDNAMNSIRSGANVPAAFIRQNSYQYSKRVDIPRM